MAGRVLISERTAGQLAVVADFFGIDMEWNSHIFRHAAQANGPAFEAVVGALAEAISQDMRFGTGRRIRERIAQEKKSK